MSKVYYSLDQSQHKLQSLHTYCKCGHDEIRETLLWTMDHLERDTHWILWDGAYYLTKEGLWLICSPIVRNQMILHITKLQQMRATQVSYLETIPEHDC